MVRSIVNHAYSLNAFPKKSFYRSHLRLKAAGRILQGIAEISPKQAKI
ncbi:hypothetical protein [Tumidithrix helvetica]